jgi:asparagine synthase (glutamine-hydrolysing)
MTMCGIAGVISPDRTIATAQVRAMCARMQPRGPDEEGIDVISTALGRVTLGSRRLAIIDRSQAGHQPMADPDRGNVLVYNGMLYNFAELRHDLERRGERFSGHSDTEVLLKLYGQMGPECLKKLRGMFAFAIWDAQRKHVFLARDRLGIKPLYYVENHSQLAFASQLKALVAAGVCATALSVEGIASYLAFGAVAEPLTALSAVRALPAGHFAVFDGHLRATRYWWPPEPDESQADETDAVTAIRSSIEESVGRHLVSDAPIGVFLSGGLDSSIIAAVAAAKTDELKTISVSFEEESFSEDRYAALVARRLESDHTTIVLSPKKLLDWAEEAFDAMDQPTFDGLNTYVVSRVASREGLTVALSGLGADELFDGYGYWRRTAMLAHLARTPRPLARIAGAAVGATIHNERGDKTAAWFSGACREEPYFLLRRVFLQHDIARLIPAWEEPGSSQAIAVN